jgi:predicted nucleotidyltransferase
MVSDARDMAELIGRFFQESARAGLISAYLFGSHAAGRAHRESDVDVAVLLAWELYPTARDRFDERVRLGADLAAALGDDRVDLVVLNDAPPHLGRRIVTTGQRVFSADPERDHAFVRDVQLRAADLEPFLRRARRLKLAAIRR